MIKAARRFEAQDELNRLDREIDIQTQEQAAGLHELLVSETAAEIKSLEQFVDYGQQSNTKTGALLNYHTANYEQLTYAATIEAAAMRLPWKQSDYGDGLGTCNAQWPKA